MTTMTTTTIKQRRVSIRRLVFWLMVEVAVAGLIGLGAWLPIKAVCDKAAVHSCAESLAHALARAREEDLRWISPLPPEKTWTELSALEYDHAVTYAKHRGGLDRGRSYWNRFGVFVDHWGKPYRTLRRRADKGAMEFTDCSPGPDRKPHTADDIYAPESPD